MILNSIVNRIFKYPSRHVPFPYEKPQPGITAMVDGVYTLLALELNHIYILLFYIIYDYEGP